MTTTKTSAGLHAIDACVAERHLLKHPFYQTWTKGELPRAALQDYARQYYHHVLAFPTYLSSLHSHTEDPNIRRDILANLIDEEAGTPNHPELWMQFAEALGLTRAEVARTELWPETKKLIDAFRLICREQSSVEGLTALYAYESQIPEVAESKMQGLRSFYGLVDAKALAYFEVHVEADRQHSAIERHALERSLSPANLQAALQAAVTVLERLWEMLSGVCKRHSLPLAQSLEGL